MPTRDENSLTTVTALHAELPSGPSKYHDPALLAEEEEILQIFKDFSRFSNEDCKERPNLGKPFYDLDDYTLFDLMGQVPRHGFEKHYNLITPYLMDAVSTFDDLEVNALSRDAGYATVIVHYRGETADGNKFNFRYRLTSVLRKREGRWRFVHEHYSFPADMKTRKADFLSGIERSIEKPLEVKVDDTENGEDVNKDR